MELINGKLYVNRAMITNLDKIYIINFGAYACESVVQGLTLKTEANVKPRFIDRASFTIDSRQLETDL